MIEPDLILTDAPDEAASAAIDDGLARYNEEQAGYWDSRPIAVVARDPATGRTLGGMLGRTALGLLFLDVVYLDKALRGQDLGGRMLRMVENEAAARGCRQAVLVTISFQAPGFYARYGWQEFGRIPCDPPGTERVFMRKALDARNA